MAITTMDGLLASLPASNFNFYKNSSLVLVSGSIGKIISLWPYDGHPGAGATPSTGAGTIYTNVTAGGIFFAPPGAGQKAYLSRFSVASPTSGTCFLFNRVWANSGLNATLNTPQTINSGNLGHPFPKQLEAYIELYATTGATGQNLTLNYVDGLGVSRSVSTVLPGNSQQFTMHPMNLHNNEGIQSITSVQFAATTGTAGNFGITVVRKLVEAPIPSSGIGVVYNSFDTGMPEMEGAACLFLGFLSNGTGVNNIIGSVSVSLG